MKMKNILNIFEYEKVLKGQKEPQKNVTYILPFEKRIAPTLHPSYLTTYYAHIKFIWPIWLPFELFLSTRIPEP